MNLSNNLETKVDVTQFSKRIDLICEFAKQSGSVRTGKKGQRCTVQNCIQVTIRA